MIDRLMKDLPSFGKNVWIRVKSVEKLGKGYSFKILRRKVLYRTPATKVPKKTVIKKHTKQYNNNTVVDYFHSDNDNRYEILIETNSRKITDIYKLKDFVDKLLQLRKGVDKDDRVKPDDINN